MISFLCLTICVILGMTPHLGQKDSEEGDSMAYKKPNDIKIEVLYDNNSYRKGLMTGWGFSCLITGAKKTILFDTGGNANVLTNNMQELEIDPKDIDIIILSHIHGDHVGGLGSILEKNPKLTVYLPESFPDRFKSDVTKYGAKIIEVDKPLTIDNMVYSTGQLGTSIKEQSLIVRTDKGMIVITGCAHPGIVTIVKRAKEIIKDDVLLVLGGFHLTGRSKDEIEKIILSFRKLGVHYVGPCHCTGYTARKSFEKAFKDNFITVGAGKVIEVGDMK